MPLIVTPQQLAQRAEFYHQLASMTAAGVPLREGLEQLRKSPPARSFRAPLAEVNLLILQGHTFSEALERSGSWLPVFDLALVQAGEESGRLDFVFRLLAHYYQERARLARSVISDLLYPAVILHLAIFILPVHMLTRLVWEGDVIGFLAQKGTILGVLYGTVFLLVYAAQSRHGEWWRAMLEKALHPIPVLGAAKRFLALARLSAALEGLIMAGVSIIKAWELSANASGSPQLRRTVLSWKPSLEAGQTPAEMVQASPAFPELFASLYATGEISGQLDVNLKRLYDHYQQEGSRKLHAVAQWTPRLVYFGIVFTVAYAVIRFWLDYFSQISDAMNF
jgi:type IV pilus assembly protein PilC